jgi:hypothetical protein
VAGRLQTQRQRACRGCQLVAQGRTLRVWLGELLPVATTAPSRTMTQLQASQARGSAEVGQSWKRTQRAPPTAPVRA